jgi:outer membrane protein TolC
LAADLTQLPSLHKQLDQAYDALAVPAGRAPSEWQVQPFDIEQFTLGQVADDLWALHAQARLSYVGARVQQFTDSASLLTALGGGWWNDKIEASAQ